MSRFVIDLGQLPFPDIIDPLDYETMLAEMKSDLQDKYPLTDLESEPIVALLETVAYHRLLDRARVNDAAKAVFLSYSTGADLDNLAAFFGVMRLVREPGDPDASPPVPPTLETDVEMRGRVTLALEAQSSAGPRGAYLYFALSADPDVLDAAVIGPDDTVSGLGALDPGKVLIVVLGQGGTTPSPLLDKVEAAVNAEDVRPLCDTVTVQAASVVTYAVTAEMTFYPGADHGAIMAQAEADLQKYASDHFRLGHDITRAGLICALYQPGVHNVDLTAPAADITVAVTHAHKIGTVTITDGGSLV